MADLTPAVHESPVVTASFSFNLSYSNLLTNYLDAKALELTAYNTWIAAQTPAHYEAWLPKTEAVFLALQAMGAGE